MSHRRIWRIRNVFVIIIIIIYGEKALLAASHGSEFCKCGLKRGKGSHGHSPWEGTEVFSKLCVFLMWLVCKSLLDTFCLSRSLLRRGLNAVIVRALTKCLLLRFVFRVLEPLKVTESLLLTFVFSEPWQCWSLSKWWFTISPPTTQGKSLCPTSLLMSPRALTKFPLPALST